MARVQPAMPPTRISLAGTRPFPIADQRLATLGALAIAIAAGLATDLVAARGPTTATNGLFVMALGLVVGLAAGGLARTRWILVPLAVAYCVGVELGRLNLVGPTLDVRFDNPYGILAFVLTRGIHALLAFLPMSLGVLAGIAFARRIGWAAPPARRRLPMGSGFLAIGVIALGLLVAWPASTPPVLGADGQPVPGSIAELVTVKLGGPTRWS